MRRLLLPSHVKETAIKAIREGFTKYTASSGIKELKEAICKKLKKDNRLDYRPSQIIVSCGAKHALYNVLEVICNVGDEVIIISPYWVSYPEKDSYDLTIVINGVSKTYSMSGYKDMVEGIRGLKHFINTLA